MELNSEPSWRKTSCKGLELRFTFNRTLHMYCVPNHRSKSKNPFNSWLEQSLISHSWMCYLTVSLLDECAAFLEVTEQIHVGVILNTDGFIHEELRKDIFHPEGHIQDVRHLEKREKPSSKQENMCFIQPLFGETSKWSGGGWGMAMLLFGNHQDNRTVVKWTTQAASKPWKCNCDSTKVSF